MAIDTTTVAAPETTQVTSQPATGTTQTGAGPNDQFLGLEPDLGFESQQNSEQDPEPAEEGSDETAEGEQETEELEAADETETEAEATEEEEGDDWLPSEQEKRFPTEVLQQYAEKRGYNWADIKDRPDLVRLLSDKLNGDIYIKQLRDAEESGATLEEQSLEDEAAETEAETTTADANATATDPRAQHYQRVDQLLTQIDSKATDELGRQLLGAMGVKTDEAYVNGLRAVARNPQATPAQRADAQQTLDLVQGAGKIGGTLARGALDLVLTTLPSVLPAVIEQIYPGTQANYERSIYQNASVNAWEGVRANKAYNDLPAFGTPEFKTLVNTAEKKLGLGQGELADLVFRGTSAKDPRGVMAGARKAYLMVAKVAKGQNVTPAAVATAVETGRRQERAVGQKRAAGRALGAGVTSRNFAQEESGDSIRDALREQIAQHNQDDFPISNITRR